MYTLAKKITVIFRLPFSVLNKTQQGIDTVPIVNITLILVTTQTHYEVCVLFLFIFFFFAFIKIFN